MLVFLGIASLLIVAFLLMVIYIAQKDIEEAAITALIGGMVVVFSMFGIFCIIEHFHPSISPIEVYRGKTTLKITYKDSIAIDSTVVWKEEVK